MTADRSKDKEFDMDAFNYVIDNFNETLEVLARKKTSPTMKNYAVQRMSLISDFRSNKYNSSQHRLPL